MKFTTEELDLINLNSKKHIYKIITFTPLSYSFNNKSTFCCIFEKSRALTDEQIRIKIIHIHPILNFILLFYSHPSYLNSLNLNLNLIYKFSFNRQIR